MAAHVILVEDDADYRALLCDFLDSVGHVVTAFETAEEALRHIDGADGETPNLVLTDLRMARMTGLDLARALRRSHPTLPIILMTAFGERSIAEEARALGASAFIEKPFLLAALREKIERMLASS